MQRLNNPGLSRRDLLRMGGVGAAAALLGGCAGAAGPRTLTWQAIPAYSLQATEPTVVEYVRKHLAAYRRRSRYSIDPQVSSADVVAAMAKLLLQASQGRAPDIAQGDSYIFGRMAEYAQPLTSQMHAAGLRLDDWFPSIQTVMTGGGPDVRGLQFTTDVRALYRRRDLVPDAPATWDEAVAMAKPLARQGKHLLFPGGRSEGSVVRARAAMACAGRQAARASAIGTSESRALSPTSAPPGCGRPFTGGHVNHNAPEDVVPPAEKSCSVRNRREPRSDVVRVDVQVRPGREAVGGYRRPEAGRRFVGVVLLRRRADQEGPDAVAWDVPIAVHEERIRARHAVGSRAAVVKGMAVPA